MMLPLVGLTADVFGVQSPQTQTPALRGGCVARVLLLAGTTRTVATLYATTNSGQPLPLDPAPARCALVRGRLLSVPTRKAARTNKSQAPLTPCALRRDAGNQPPAVKREHAALLASPDGDTEYPVATSRG